MMREGRNGGKLKTGGNNGGGRPPKLPQLDVLLDKVLGDNIDGITAAEKILNALRERANKGDVRAAEVLLDRAYGKAKQTNIVEFKEQPIFTGIDLNVKSNDSTAEDSIPE